MIMLVYRGRRGETPLAPGYYIMCLRHGRRVPSVWGHIIVSIHECWAKSFAAAFSRNTGRAGYFALRMFASTLTNEI